MPKDLSDVETDEDDLSPEQERLMVWRDYFALLRKGLSMKGAGRESDISQKEKETEMWLRVVIAEIESDILHLECGQEEYCRWGDAKDLTSLDGNIDARNE